MATKIPPIILKLPSNFGTYSPLAKFRSGNPAKAISNTRKFENSLPNPNPKSKKKS